MLKASILPEIVKYEETGTDATKNLNDATLKSNAGTSATESLGIKDSNKQISPEHQAILVETS